MQADKCKSLSRPSTNRPAYCCPNAGDGTAELNTTRACRQIAPYDNGAGTTSTPWRIEDLPTTSNPNPCYWTNLAGQTPDTQSQWNSPFRNFFVTIGPYTKPNSRNTDHVLPATPDPAYYAQVRTGNAGYADGYAECQVAQEHYASFNAALNRYNCEEQYSHWNCDDCRKAYARWAAAMALPACALGAGETAGGASCTAIKPCIRICQDVVKKCPVTLQFTCPSDNHDYGEGPYCKTLKYSENTFTPSTFTDPTASPTTVPYAYETSTKSLTYTTDCCNPMGLQNSARSTAACLALVVLNLLLVHLVGKM